MAALKKTLKLLVQTKGRQRIKYFKSQGSYDKWLREGRGKPIKGDVVKGTPAMSGATVTKEVGGIGKTGRTVRFVVRDKNGVVLTETKRKRDAEQLKQFVDKKWDGQGDVDTAFNQWRNKMQDIASIERISAKKPKGNKAMPEKPLNEYQAIKQQKEMTNRQGRTEVIKKAGTRDGKIDSVYNDGINTLQERAARSWVKSGQRTHKKQYMKAYMEEARKIEKAWGKPYKINDTGTLKISSMGKSAKKVKKKKVMSQEEKNQLSLATVHETMGPHYRDIHWVGTRPYVDRTQQITTAASQKEFAITIKKTKTKKAKQDPMENMEGVSMSGAARNLIRNLK